MKEKEIPNVFYSSISVAYTQINEYLHQLGKTHMITVSEAGSNFYPVHVDKQKNKDFLLVTVASEGKINTQILLVLEPIIAEQKLTFRLEDIRLKQKSPLISVAFGLFKNQMKRRIQERLDGVIDELELMIETRVFPRIIQSGEDYGVKPSASFKQVEFRKINLNQENLNIDMGMAFDFELRIEDLSKLMSSAHEALKS